MKTYTKTELEMILALHNEWLLDNSKGSRANLSNATLINATLINADLRDADLINANLSYANLSDANLSYANLSYANLSDADLRSADLSNANLSNANLSGADLSDANLSNANLSGANLSGANLSGTDLRSADLSEIKEDFFGKMLSLKNEVSRLYKALLSGKVDGSTYSGECACFVGTIANIRNTYYREMPDLSPQSTSPIEKFFLAINRGGTPETNQVSKITSDWCKEFMISNNIQVPTMSIAWDI